MLADLGFCVPAALCGTPSAGSVKIIHANEKIRCSQLL
jgi:hypothetical protein